MFFKHTNGSTRHVDPAQLEDLAHLKITDAKPGDTLSISGAGDQFADLDFTLDRRAMVEFAEKRWVELSGLYRDHRVTLEVHNDEEVQVFGALDGKHLTLDQIGLSEQDLADLDARQNASDNFDYDGKTWLYRWSREIGTFADNQMPGAGCYAWRFQEQNSDRLLTVRKAEGQPFEAVVSIKIDPGDITVYRG